MRRLPAFSIVLCLTAVVSSPMARADADLDGKLTFIDSLRTERSNREAAITAKNAVVSQLTSQMAALNERRSSLTASLTEVQARAASAASQLTSSVADVAQKGASLTSLQTELAAAGSKLKEGATALASKLQEIAAHEAEALRANAFLAELRSEEERMTAALAALRAVSGTDEVGAKAVASARSDLSNLFPVERDAERLSRQVGSIRVGDHRCTGFEVGRDLVQTALHCVDGNLSDLPSTSYIDGAGASHSIESLQLSDKGHDLAVLKLSSASGSYMDLTTALQVDEPLLLLSYDAKSNATSLVPISLLFAESGVVTREKQIVRIVTWVDRKGNKVVS